MTALHSSAERLPRRHRRASNALLPASLLVLGAAAPFSSVAGQRLPVEPGDRVRVAAADAATLGPWREGTVVAATRLGMLVSGASFGGDSVPVALNPQIRLQVRRRSIGFVAVGTATGLGIGAGIGLFGYDRWGDGKPGNHAEFVYGTLAGAAVGWLTSWLWGPKPWHEVPLTAGGVGVVPLTRPSAGNAHWAKTERWTAFTPTEADFAAFFWAHRDSLHVIEGIWQLEPISVYDSRIAIARDERYPGWGYVAVSLPRLRTTDQARGRIIWALRRRSEPGAVYDVHETDGPGPTLDAVVREGTLQIRYPFLREWIRVPLLPPR